MKFLISVVFCEFYVKLTSVSHHNLIEIRSEMPLVEKKSEKIEEIDIFKDTKCFIHENFNGKPSLLALLIQVSLVSGRNHEKRSPAFHVINDLIYSCHNLMFWFSIKFSLIC